MTTDVGLALVALGTAVIALSTLGALVMRTSVYDRVHFLTPVTSIGSPMLVAGLGVLRGPGLPTATLVVIAVLLFVTGPVLEAATGRMLAQLEGRVSPSSPE